MAASPLAGKRIVVTGGGEKDGRFMGVAVK